MSEFVPGIVTFYNYHDYNTTDDLGLATTSILKNKKERTPCIRFISIEHRTEARPVAKTRPPKKLF